MKTAMDTIKKQVRNSASKMLEHLKNMEQMQTRKQCWMLTKLTGKTYFDRESVVSFWFL